ncbi:MAG: hotdog fold thioesterase [Flavobacteriales bacterium]|nr:hotdog fold thioesterase [Flavobacteriales bacterium]
MKSPSEIVNTMMNSDAFSKWLGINLIQINRGICVLNCKVTEEMLNGFKIAHGGITYSIADSCLAFASNSHGYQCVSIETSISHVKKVMSGDELTASSREISRSRKIGIYEISVHNQKEELVASFKGTVFISENLW